MQEKMYRIKTEIADALAALVDLLDITMERMEKEIVRRKVRLYLDVSNRLIHRAEELTGEMEL